MVEDQKIEPGVRALKLLERLHRTAAVDYAVIVRLQEGPKDFPDRGLVVDHEDVQAWIVQGKVSAAGRRRVSCVASGPGVVAAILGRLT